MTFASELMAKIKAGVSPREAYSSVRSERMARYKAQQASSVVSGPSTSSGGGQTASRSLPLPAGIDPASKLGQVLIKIAPVVTPKEGKVYKNIQIKTMEDVITPKVPETLTTQQYFQKTGEVKKEIGKQKSEYYALQESIDPKAVYMYKGMKVPGVILKARIEREYLPKFEEAERQSQLAWSQARDIRIGAHPETRFVKTDKGYSIKYPFAGAEKYHTYKKQLKKAGPLGLFATALTPEDPLGLVSTYYTATGQKEKGVEIKVKSMARVKSLDFIKDPLGVVLWTAGTPLTSIALAAVGGYGVTKAVPYVAGFATAKLGVVGGLAVKGGALATGVYLGGSEVLGIKSMWEQGKEGEAFGRAGMLGFQIAGAYGGYRLAGGRAGTLKFEQKGYQRGTQFDTVVFKKFVPQSVKSIYGKLTSEIGGFKTRAGAQRYYDRVSSLMSEKQLSKAELYHAKQLAKRYEMGDTGFPRYDPNIMESDVLSGRMLRPEIYSFKKGVSRPLSQAHLYGRKGMAGSLEGLTTLEQIYGKRPDPFTSYKAKDVWGMSWDAYRTTIPDLVSKVTVTEVPFTMKLGKGVTYSDTLRMVKRTKVWENMFAEHPYATKRPSGKLPQLATGKFPKEFTTGPVMPKLVDYGFKTGKTPFQIIKPKVTDISITPSKTGQQTITTFKGVGMGTRFRLIHDVTDVRFLRHLESLEPMYKPTTSILAPSHIKKGMSIRIPTMRSMDGMVVFDASLSLGGRTRMMPDFDVVHMPKVKPMLPMFETVQKSLTKTDYKRDLESGLKMGQVFDTTLLTGVKTDQLLGQVQKTGQMQAFEEITVTPPVQTMQPLFPDFPMMDMYHPRYPVTLPSKKFVDFFAPPIDKGLYGGGRAAGSMEFFGKAKKFRKGELDMIFGIEV